MFVRFPILAGALLLQLVSTSLAAVTVSTFAGAGGYRHNDEPTSRVALSFPYSVTVDSSGTVYITESQEDHIYKISPDGIVSTINMNWNTHDVALTRHIAVDARGNIFMTHYRSNRVYRVTLNGHVSVYAGGKEPGYVDGPARTARFNDLKGLVVDPNGNLIVVDSGNHCIRKISPNGIVSTLAGTGTMGLRHGPGARAQFESPSCIAVDPHGNLYVVDNGTSSIRKITPDGIVSRFSGLQRMSSRRITNHISSYRIPKGIAADANGNVFITDWFDSRIYKITPNGIMSVVVGDGIFGYVDGPGQEARFSRLYGLAVDHDGNLLVADSWNHRIRKITFTSNNNNRSINQSRNSVPPRPIRYNQDECAICYEIKADDDAYDYCSTSCGNTFHKRCIDRCMTRRTQRRCPMCRSEWIMFKPHVAIPTASAEETEE